MDTHERGKETVLLSSSTFRNNADSATLKNKPVSQIKREKKGSPTHLLIAELSSFIQYNNKGLRLPFLLLFHCLLPSRYKNLLPLIAYMLTKYNVYPSTDYKSANKFTLNRPLFPHRPTSYGGV